MEVGYERSYWMKFWYVLDWLLDGAWRAIGWTA